MKKIKKIVFFLWNIPKNIIIFLIICYQKTLSPDHSVWAKKLYPHGYCKFYPTCSSYTKQSIKKRGLIIGSVKGLWRILRCNPWNRGGVDHP